MKLNLKLPISSTMTTLAFTFLQTIHGMEGFSESRESKIQPGIHLNKGADEAVKQDRTRKRRRSTSQETEQTGMQLSEGTDDTVIKERTRKRRRSTRQEAEQTRIKQQEKFKSWNSSIDTTIQHIWELRKKDSKLTYGQLVKVLDEMEFFYRDSEAGNHMRAWRDDLFFRHFTQTYDEVKQSISKQEMQQQSVNTVVASIMKKILKKYARDSMERYQYSCLRPHERHPRWNDLKVSSLSTQTDNISPYDNELEYKLHQYVSYRFFRRITRKPETRLMVRAFKEELKSHCQLTPIKLDGLSSRTRILLFRELTALCCANNIISIPFIFYNKEFQIKLKPSLRQPGDGIVTTIGKHSEIYEILHNLTPESQQKIADKITALRKKKPYHPSDPAFQIYLDGKMLDLEILNILLDFEVARRLQWFEGEETKSRFAREIQAYSRYIHDVRDVKRRGRTAGSEEQDKKAKRVLVAQKAFADFVTSSKQSHNINLEKEERHGKDEMRDRKFRFLLDSIPVASAILSALKLSSSGSEELKIFFHASNKPDSGYNYGEYNAFEGAPAMHHREDAVKRIFNRRNLTKNSTKQEIHQDYLDYFGGSSESEGEEYR